MGTEKAWTWTIWQADGGAKESFQFFMRMPPAMFNELVQRLTPRLNKQGTNYHASLKPGLKVAITLWHLVSGNTYRNMQYAWRVPHNTISVVVREVVEEYTDELLFCPTTKQGWRDLTDQWYQRWNFPNIVGAIDGKHVACKAPFNSGLHAQNAAIPTLASLLNQRLLPIRQR